MIIFNFAFRLFIDIYFKLKESIKLIGKKNSLSFKRTIAASLMSVVALQASYNSTVIRAIGSDFPDKTVFATKDEISSSWGTPILDNNKKIVEGKNATHQKIILGKNPETNKPMSWWVASRITANGKVSANPGSSSHMIICAAQSMANQNFSSTETDEIDVSSLKDSLQKEFIYTDNSKHDKVSPNHYGASGCRKSLKTVSASSGVFSKGEKKIIKETDIKTFDFKNSSVCITKDKLYLPSSNSKFDIISWTEDDITVLDNLSQIKPETVIPVDYLLKNSRKDEIIMWSRSVDSKKPSCASAVNLSSDKKVSYPGIAYSFDLMPIAKVNVESLLFASAASSVYADDVRTLNGRFCKVDKNSQSNGMHLKFRADETELTDGFVFLDKDNASRVHYGNVPSNSYLTVCATEKDDTSKSYTTAIKLNENGNTPDGFIDLEKLDTEVIPKGKTLNVMVWVERLEENGVVVATNPISSKFTVGESLNVSGVKSTTYNGNEQTLSGLIVKFADKTLVLGTDYTVTYSSNKNSGTALAVINGINNYKGYEKSSCFEITPAKAKITLQDKSVAFDGKGKFIDNAVVTGVTSNDVPKSKITYTYYKDEQCKKKIFSYNSSSDKTKILNKAPTDLGTYYVKAVILKDENYLESESNIAKLQIVESL